MTLLVTLLLVAAAFTVFNVAAHLVYGHAPRTEHPSVDRDAVRARRELDAIRTRFEDTRAGRPQACSASVARNASTARRYSCGRFVVNEVTGTGTRK